MTLRRDGLAGLLGATAVALLTACVPPSAVYGPAAGGAETTAPRARAAVAESRVILDENFTWASAAGADATLDRIQRAGFNVIVPCVWAGQGTSWPSNLEIADPRVAKYIAAGDDPLAVLIAKAHARGIEVHPWFKVAARWRDFRQEFYDAGTPERAFNLHQPGFRRYIVDLIAEVATRYDIDGINLDYVRTKGLCTSDFCVTDYRQKTGRDLRRDTTSMQPRSAAWEQVRAWNSAAVDDIVRTASQRARAARPGLLVSADTHTNRDHWRIQGADGVAWINRGWVDVLYNMQYTSTLKQDEIDAAVAALDEPQRMVILNGNWLPPTRKNGAPGSRPGHEVAAAIAASQRRYPGGNGVALYQYKYMTDEQVTALASGPFRVPAYPSWPAKRHRAAQ